MRFVCNRTDIIDAITNVQRAVSGKSSVPVLEGVLIRTGEGKVIMSGYDLEIGITTEIEAKVYEPGEVVLKAKLLADAVRCMPDERISFYVDDRLVTDLSCGNVNYQIVGISSVDFPDLPSFESRYEIEMDAEVLKNMIKQTRFAIADNTQKPVYTGALFEINNEDFTMVSLDGYRMAIRKEKIKFSDTIKIVVPGKTLAEVLRFNTEEDEKITIIIGNRHVTFKIRNFCLVSRLLDGAFLNYTSSIPNTWKTALTIKTSTIIESVERMAILNADKLLSPLTCFFDTVHNEIKFNCSTNLGRASDAIDVDIDGENITIGFNHRYLLDALKNTDTDEVRLEFNGDKQPVKITPVGSESFIFIVLPMRLS